MNTAILLQTETQTQATTSNLKKEKKKSTTVERNMVVAFWLNFIFSCIEFVGGVMTNSVTVISDAIHDLGDSMAIGLSLVLEKKSNKGTTNKYTYGQRRFSVLAAFFTSLVLIIGSVYIVYEAVSRLFVLQEVHSEGVIWLAVLGIVFNGLAVLRLRKGNEQSLSQRSIMLHLIEDVLGWVAVLIGAIIMYYTNWFWIDPILSLSIAAMILYNAIKNIRSSIKIFLQSTPDEFNTEELKAKLLSLTNVKDVSNIYCWTLDGEKHILVLHIICDNTTIANDDVHSLKSKVQSFLKNGENYSVTVEVGK